MFISVSPPFHLLLPRGTLTTFFGYAVNTLNTTWRGCVRGPVGLGVSMCALGPLKEIALERWEKRTGETCRGSLGLVDRDCIEVDFGS